MTLSSLSSALLLTGLALLLLRLINSFVLLPLSHARKARALHCGPIPLEPTKWPLGLDMVLAGLRSDREQRTTDFITQRFAAMKKHAGAQQQNCNTFRMRILGTSNIMTADPANVQAVLASQFADFGMGAARSTVLKPILRRSIFASDGKAWHAARETVRPIFARENIADLALLEGHVQTLFACIEQNNGIGEDGWTQKPVGLAGLFPCLTMDSATELFLGHSTHSLEARLHRNGLDAPQHNFHWAFETIQATVSVRMRLRGLYWVYGGRTIDQCMDILNAFVDDAIRMADSTASTTKKNKYDYLNTLRARCADQAEVREQIMGLLAAGRDTTANLMSWVFYRLVRDERVFTKLRNIILDEFGPDSATITFEKLKACRYLQHVLNETLRVNSIVAFNSRRALRDTTLPTGGGPDGLQRVFVPRGTEVNFSTHVMHRRADLWGADAAQFIPERWETMTKRPGWSFVPFNGGPRICIGQQYALTEAAYVVVRLLQRYEGIRGVDVDVDGEKTREYTRFTVVAGPGTPDVGEEAVRCVFKVAGG